MQQAETITENFNTPTPKAQGSEVVSKKKKTGARRLISVMVLCSPVILKALSMKSHQHGCPKEPNKGDTNGYAKVDHKNLTRSQPCTKNYEENKAESERSDIHQGRACQWLIVQRQTVSLKDIHTHK